MRIWILIFSAALFVGGTCLGVALQPRLAPTPKPEPKPDPGAPPPTWGHRKPFISVHRFASELQLSDEQDRALDNILSESQEETQALGRAMRAAQDKSRQRITDLLTSEQKTKLDSLMAAESQKRAEADLDRTVTSYTKILVLTDEQAKSLRAALTEARNRRREGYKPGADHQQIRKDSREQLNKDLERALSPEQYKRYLEVSELERFER
jgi:Spy/CpxP family protein refolding chaperone